MGFTDGEPTNQTRANERRGSRGDPRGPGITTWWERKKKYKVFASRDLPSCEWVAGCLVALGYRWTRDSEDVSADVALTGGAAGAAARTQTGAALTLK